MNARPDRFDDDEESDKDKKDKDGEKKPEPGSDLPGRAVSGDEHENAGAPKDAEKAKTDTQAMMQAAASRPAAPKFVRVRTVLGWRIDIMEGSLALVVESDQTDIFVHASGAQLEALESMLKASDMKAKIPVQQITRFPRPEDAQLEMNLTG